MKVAEVDFTANSATVFVVELTRWFKEHYLKLSDDKFCVWRVGVCLPAKPLTETRPWEVIVCCSPVAGWGGVRVNNA